MKLRLPALLILLLLGVCVRPSAAAEVRFNRDVQPILSEYCFQCHGPDSASRKPKSQPLRLDRVQDAFAPREDGQPVILTGKPGASELVRRIKATDDDMMPPASIHKTMKPQEIAVIERWIQQGAKYEEHWSFLVPVQSDLPKVPKAWAGNSIDPFIYAKLREHSLRPNAEEQRVRLFRRLSFDLTGLPPTREAATSFLADKSPLAYESAVDRMLESTASAEHFTRLWLDAVRYADTQGIHHDHERSIWPYRDWVIAAIQANMPFDQFTVEQIAGDLLPDATLDQKIASGYNRLLPTTGEGGAIPEEYLAIYAKDRVDTTAAVWLGLTTGCASCHDHKFDPISTKDFYAMTAFFRNHTSPALDSGSHGNTAPVLFVPAQEDRPRWVQLEKAIQDKMGQIADRKKSGRDDFEKWLAAAEVQPLSSALEFPLVNYLPLVETNSTSRSFDAATRPEMRAGPFGPALPVGNGQAVTNVTFDLTRHGQGSYGAFLSVDQTPSGAVFARMDQAKKHRGWDLFLSDGKPTIHIIDRYPEATLKVTAKRALEPGRWHHVMAVFDGTRKGASAIRLFVNGREADVDVNNNTLGPDIAAQTEFRLGGRSDGAGIANPLQNGKVFLQDLRFYDRALSSTEVTRLALAGLLREHFTKPVDERKQPQVDAFYDLYITGFDVPSRALNAEVEKFHSEAGELRERGANTLVMEEKKDSEPTAFILTRGQYTSKGESVNAATPAVLPAFAPDLPRNRLGLARWMVSPENPLTARVTVNRVWAHLFGMGLVETTEDFGVMGARPSHPELLDRLAIDFVKSGWNFRQLVKSIVTSAAYRQSAQVSAEKLAKDPLNRWVSRGPHLRLDAEQIRDQALAASGLLVAKVGGPPVKPYQPEGVWEAVAMPSSDTAKYKAQQGEALYRRSFYTFWKRTAPPASMEILNAPSRETFCTRRERTDTPLQAFVMLNDPQFVEAARTLATKAMRSTATWDDRLDVITGALLARTLVKPERSVVLRMHERALQTYRQDVKSAEALLRVGESKPDESLPAAELAAWTLVASQIMNLDESLTK